MRIWLAARFGLKGVRPSRLHLEMIRTMKTKLAIFWALATIPALSNPSNSGETATEAAPAPDCRQNTLSLLESLPSEKEAIEGWVTNAVTRFPNCSCEIVKAVIEKTKAEPKLVATIVEAAIVAAPEHMRLTAQCAIAVAPDALVDVQAVLASLEGNAGESGKSSKSGKEVVSSKDSKGGTPEPAADPKNYDNLMNPAYLPIGVPGALPPTYQVIDIPGTTEVDTEL